MSVGPNLAVVVLMPGALELANRIAKHIGGEVHGARSRIAHADILFDDTKDHLQSLFQAKVPIVAIAASGAIIRLLAPVLSDKQDEPPVLAIAADGSSVVPLLGGHHGANDLARSIGDVLGANAAITTAGDLQFGVALDAPPAGYHLANPDNAKSVMVALVAGGSATLNGDAEWLRTSQLPFSASGDVTLTVTYHAKSGGPAELVYHPQTLVMGMGCERGIDPQKAIALAQAALNEQGLAPQSLAAITSIDVKADEVAIHAVADHFGVPARFFAAAELEAQANRLKNPSEIVFAEVGCHGVAEGAALAAAGVDAELVVEKTKSKRATVAIARSAVLDDSKSNGRSRGKLFVVGIGPGQKAWRSGEVEAMIAESTDLVGYSLYLNLIADIAGSRVQHRFDLGKEEDRVRHAMELAGRGKNVALVCSGDAGIYAMATLVFELMESGDLTDGARRVDVAVSPGISALQGAAARAGAPLGHDFCTISLSDLLTPWESIQRRLKAAGEGDFVIAFYNPVSKRRRTQLAYARDVLLQHRPTDTPVILASNLGRDGESVRVVRLGDLQVDDVDMLTVVVVGSSNSRTVKTGDGRTWVYTPRGYDAKPESRIAHAAQEQERKSA
ncbi:MAG: precorrin-3B C(17)-methyltransferase [Pseudomonadota bacterium]